MDEETLFRWVCMSGKRCPLRENVFVVVVKKRKDENGERKRTGTE